MALDPRVALLAELADPTRFAVLEQLERGPASASQLAERLAASPTQLANHLRRLREAGLVAVTPQGRLAVYELAEPGLREVFSMLNGLRGSPPSLERAAHPAASCYDHLAGPLGVALLDRLVELGALIARSGEGELQLGPNASRAFAELGVDLPTGPTRRMRAYACMDSIVRRPHLGGLLGARLADSLRERGWVLPSDRPRRLSITPLGRGELLRYGLAVDAIS